ncbi:hypothetical protein FE257_004412 [Aspergillus nanangensis]|uniref:Uncharacterized protein n=1 Tax=Aspergillus nanangensis TaxID=2582783 RepID=A0AAD4GZB5_ASPNN|nr:hypothetical protein FE257_004412 [Aspergillus nanangensis]
MDQLTCEICGVEFQRAEHLSRHSLRHLGIRPFSCTVCGSAFGRRDTLQRHMAVHRKPNGTESLSVTKRPSLPPRAKRACRQCSQSKVRCSGGHPCHRCQTKNIGCSYPPKLQRRETRTAPMGVDSYATTAGFAWDWYPGDQAAYDVGRTSSSLDYYVPDEADMAVLGVFGSHLSGALPESWGFRPPSSPPHGIDLLDMAPANSPHCQSPLFPDLFQVPPPETALSSVDRTAETTDFSPFPELCPTKNTPWTAVMSRSAPVPSFCGARSSPEPQEGQSLGFREFLEKAWTRRPRHEQSNIASSSVESTPEGATGTERGSSQDEAFLGVFPSTLSLDSSQFDWASEELGHVGPLPRETYDKISRCFQTVNQENGHYSPFASGDFPSLSACSTFMQRYFEHFSPYFPFLHHPTFDPSKENWLLVLAIIVTGCRFSKNLDAVKCMDTMQEFLRRAINTMVSFNLSGGPLTPAAWQ